MNERTDWSSLDSHSAEAAPPIGRGVPAALGRFTLVGVLPSESSQQLAALLRGALAARFPQADRKFKAPFPTPLAPSSPAQRPD